MATNLKIPVIQKNHLFELLMLKKSDQAIGKSTHALDILILKTKTTMEQEDVAWVEKNIAQLP